MSKLLLALLALHTVTLTWKQSPAPGLIGNTISCGSKHGGPYKLIAQTSKPVTKASAPAAAGTYYCVVTAQQLYSARPRVVLTSPPSNEVKVSVP